MHGLIFLALFYFYMDMLQEQDLVEVEHGTWSVSLESQVELMQRVRAHTKRVRIAARLHLDHVNGGNACLGHVRLPKEIEDERQQVGLRFALLTCFANTIGLCHLWGC